MGVVLRAEGADFSSNPVAFLPPVSRGLEYFAFLGGTSERTARNLAAGKPQGAIIGAPVISANYARLNRTAYVQTGAAQTPNNTLIVVLRPVDDTSGVLAIGNYGSPRVAPYSGTTNGCGFFWTSSAADGSVTCYFTAAAFDGASAASVNTPNTTRAIPGAAWRAMAGGASGTDKTKFIRDLTAGTRVDATYAAPNNVADLGSTPLMIGSGVNTGVFAGSVDIAFAAIYSVKLTDAEIDLVYSSVKAFLLTKGITV